MMEQILGFTGKYRFLSNYYMVNINLSGIVYPSSEHAFQAAKSMDVNDKLRIAKLNKPGDAKRAGRKLKLRDDWIDMRINIMKHIVKEKFLQHSDLRQRLINTGNAYLEETNRWKDRFWGVCNNMGENHLGKILMEVREELKQ